MLMLLRKFYLDTDGRGNADFTCHAVFHIPQLHCGMWNTACRLRLIVRIWSYLIRYCTGRYSTRVQCTVSRICFHAWKLTCQFSFVLRFLQDVPDLISVVQLLQNSNICQPYRQLNHQNGLLNLLTRDGSASLD